MILNIIKEAAEKEFNTVLQGGHFDNIFPQDTLIVIFVSNAGNDVVPHKLEDKPISFNVLGNEASFIVNKTNKTHKLKLDTNFTLDKESVFVLVKADLEKKKVEEILMTTDETVDKIVEELVLNPNQFVVLQGVILSQTPPNNLNMEVKVSKQDKSSSKIVTIIVSIILLLLLAAGVFYLVNRNKSTMSVSV